MLLIPHAVFERSVDKKGVFISLVHFVEETGFNQRSEVRFRFDVELVFQNLWKNETDDGKMKIMSFSWRVIYSLY